MTIQEMHNEFRLLLDKGDSFDAPSFLISEVDGFLNIAIEKFVTKRMFGNNVRRTGFEEDQKRRDDLRELIVQIPLSSAAITEANKPNGKFFSLPLDYRHAINEEALISETNDSSKLKRRVSVKPITHDRYNKIIDDPFNKPEKNTVYRLDYGDSFFELISGDNITVEEYYLRYIKNPSQVDSVTSVSSDLALHTHKEIVRMAVVEALENVEQPRYQSSKIELNEIE